MGADALNVTIPEWHPECAPTPCVGCGAEIDYLVNTHGVCARCYVRLFLVTKRLYPGIDASEAFSFSEKSGTE